MISPKYSCLSTDDTDSLPAVCSSRDFPGAPTGAGVDTELGRMVADTGCSFKVRPPSKASPSRAASLNSRRVSSCWYRVPSKSECRALSPTPSPLDPRWSVGPHSGSARWKVTVCVLSAGGYEWRLSCALPPTPDTPSRQSLQTSIGGAPVFPDACTRYAWPEVGPPSWVEESWSCWVGPGVWRVS